MSTSSAAFEGLAATLRALAAPGSGVHAVLLYGAPGAPTAEAAGDLTALWLSGGEPDTPAERAFRAGRCVDYQAAKPWSKGNWIKNSAICEPKEAEADPFEGTPLLEFFRSRPTLARKKVFAFLDAHRLTREASSALLKTLEEPHDHARIVLTSDRFGQVAATVRSRCACVPVELGPPEPAGEPVLDCFAESPADRSRVEAHRSAYDRLWAVLESTQTAPAYAADALAERFRQCGEKLAHALGEPARLGHMEALRCAAGYLRAQRPLRPALISLVAESHRAVESYAGIGLVTDLLFVEWVGLGTATGGSGV